MKASYLLIIALLTFNVLFSVLAHEEVPEEINDLTDNALSDHGVNLKQQTLNVTIGVGLFVIILLLTALRYQERFTERQKWLFFLGLALPIAAVTLYVAGTTIYLNLTSHTGGPVHWHADFELWNCGEQIDLRDPTGLSNRIGSPVFHEHGDNRIHVEGVVLNRGDANLHRFFEFIGGTLTAEKLVVPTNNGVVEAGNGGSCNGFPGKVQVFVYKTEGRKYEQFKANADYVLSPSSLVPPGDCLIIEFAAEKEKTDKLCASYKTAIARGELHG